LCCNRVEGTDNPISRQTHGKYRSYVVPAEGTLPLAGWLAGWLAGATLNAARRLPGHRRLDLSGTVAPTNGPNNRPAYAGERKAAVR
jgi:hypothetical protein